MADLIGHALLKQEEEPPQRVKELCIHLAFGILDHVLNRSAPRRDPRTSSDGEGDSLGGTTETGGGYNCADE